MFRKTIFFFLILAAASVAAIADSRPTAAIVAREHYLIIEANGSEHKATELVFAGDVEAFVTLWQTPDGKRFIVRSTINDSTRTVSMSVAGVGTGEFIRVSHPIPVAPGTPAEVKQRSAVLSAAEWQVPMTVAARNFEATAAAPAQTSLGKIGAALRKSVDGEFLRGAADVLVMASRAGSPAGRSVCDAVGPLLAEGASCKQSADVQALPEEEDCAFDAKFGYGCAE